MFPWELGGQPYCTVHVGPLQLRRRKAYSRIYHTFNHSLKCGTYFISFSNEWSAHELCFFHFVQENAQLKNASMRAAQL